MQPHFQHYINKESELQIPPIPEPSEAFKAKAQELLDQKTKPQGSLGRLEEVAEQLCAIQHQIPPATTKKRVLLFAADHGIVAEGVSAYPQEVTTQMLANFVAGGAAISVLARLAGLELKLIDVGVVADTPLGVINRKIRRGTRNFALGPALTQEEVCQAIAVGLEQAHQAAAEGVHLLCFGEMGIGNTASASALLSLLTCTPPEKTVGRGTGLSDAQLAHKIAVIEKALALHSLHVRGPLDALSAVGGLEIAALTGAILGAAAHRIPAIVDGFIVTVAALLATQLSPSVRGALLFAHCSAEKGHRHVLEILKAKPLLDLDMRLGEGSAAALASFFVEAAARLLREMASFSEAGVSTRQDESPHAS